MNGGAPPNDTMLSECARCTAICARGHEPQAQHGGLAIQCQRPTPQGRGKQRTAPARCGTPATRRPNDHCSKLGGPACADARTLQPQPGHSAAARARHALSLARAANVSTSGRA